MGINKDELRAIYQRMTDSELRSLLRAFEKDLERNLGKKKSVYFIRRRMEVINAVLEARGANEKKVEKEKAARNKKVRRA